MGENRTCGERFFLAKETVTEEAGACQWSPVTLLLHAPALHRRVNIDRRFAPALFPPQSERNGLRVSSAVNLLELVLAQSDLRASDVLFQVLDRRGAGDGQDRW